MDISKLSTLIPQQVLDQLPQVMDSFNINTPLRLAHFLGQVSHESQNFTKTEENLNYSATQLFKTFPTHFKSNLDAFPFANHPEAIANHVYCNRMGNSTESSGDGWKYRGRGYLQTTGKYEYIILGKFLKTDLVNSPDLLTSSLALSSAAYFFMSNGLLPLSDEGMTLEIVTLITHKINGGILGLPQRVNDCTEIYNILCTF